MGGHFFLQSILLYANFHVYDPLKWQSRGRPMIAIYLVVVITLYSPHLICALRACGSLGNPPEGAKDNLSASRAEKVLD